MINLFINLTFAWNFHDDYVEVNSQQNLASRWNRISQQLFDKDVYLIVIKDF